MFSASNRLAQFIPSSQTRRGDFALNAAAFQKAKEVVGQERIVGNYVDVGAAMMDALRAELEAVRTYLLKELEACRSFELNHAQQLFEQMSEAKREDISELQAKLNRLEQELATATVSSFTDAIERKYDEHLPPVREAVQLKLA